MSRCRDLAIFLVTTTDRQTDRLLYPCACARGKKGGTEIIKSGTAADFGPKIGTVPLKAGQLVSMVFGRGIAFSSRNSMNITIPMD